jgi:S-adenosylmethionine:tRNA ribosyltransferase-isomerase
MRTQDFDFYLPEKLIAQHPTPNRTASHLLVLDGHSGELADRQFANLPQLLQPGDCLVFNDTRVIKARMFGQKATGGAVEVLVERITSPQEAWAHIRASRAPAPGSRIQLGSQGSYFEAEVLGRDDDLFHLRFLTQQTVLEILEQIGHLPLPPYITHHADADDEARYQTVYAKHAGAVAAPTAGLHFDGQMLTALQTMGIDIAYITLHVGAGTFQPVRVENIADHKMHSEWYTVPQTTVDCIEQTKRAGKSVIAVGTTSLRALESAARSGKLMATSAETDIFITPGYQFRVIDKLITNFHLPKSTLLMLVSAFAGMENIRHAYQHAVQQQYRFFSYGDAMLISKK